MNAADKSSKRSSEVTEPVVIPVVEETIELGHRVVDTGRGVRVTKHVTEREAHIEDPLMHEDVTVERVPIDMLINGPEPNSRRGFPDLACFGRQSGCAGGRAA
jgi:stress response protein YsnF